ncbi:MAG: tRNA (adenosine(37)-N6)-threonylcarbamoyltransferase complex dimerization subunit type 1 TsaB [Myxococcota bacterium]
MLLAITTSTPRFSAALADLGGNPLQHRVGEHPPSAHAESMFPTIDAMVKEAGATPRAIAAVACDIGPGSFTGTRVGLAAAKGIAFALDVPLWPVVSLEALAAEARAATGATRIATVVDAKRGESFLAAFGGDRDEPPEAVPKERVAARLAAWGPDLVYGQGLPDALALPRWSDGVGFVDARWVATVALRHAASGAQVPDLDRLEPLYAREPDAKLPRPVGSTIGRG